MRGPTTDLDALRRDITREIERLASEAGTKAMNGAPANTEVDRIKELQAVLTALPHKESFPLRWAVIVGTVCLIGASLTWTIAIPRARVQLNFTAASIIMQLTDDFTWDGNWQVNPPLRLLEFTHLDLPARVRNTGGSRKRRFARAECGRRQHTYRPSVYWTGRLVDDREQRRRRHRHRRAWSAVPR